MKSSEKLWGTGSPSAGRVEGARDRSIIAHGGGTVTMYDAALGASWFRAKVL